MGLLKHEEQCLMEENLKVVWEQVFKFKLGRFDAKPSNGSGLWNMETVVEMPKNTFYFETSGNLHCLHNLWMGPISLSIMIH
jgi:hypothetical protein